MRYIDMRNEQCWYKDVCQVECEPNCLRYNEMKFLMDNSDIPPNRQMPSKLKPESADVKAFEELNGIRLDIVNFVKNGENLYLWSSTTGNGKTSWSIKLLLRYFNDIWPGNGFRVRGKFVYTPMLLTQLKNFSNPLSDEYKNDILNCDLLVLDDVACTNVSQFDLSQLLYFIDYRTFNNKSIIYTGNLNFNDLHSALGAKLASRIWAKNTTVIELKGSDRR